MLPCSTSLCPASASAAEPDGGRAVQGTFKLSVPRRAVPTFRVPHPASCLQRKITCSHGPPWHVDRRKPFQVPGGRFLSDS